MTQTLAPSKTADPKAAPSKSTSYAAATQPIQDSSVIHTDSEGLVAGEVSFQSAGQVIPAYRAAPDAPGKHPIVLVIQEIFGVHEHIRDITRRLAKLGYLAVAPELYVRQGDASRISDMDELFRSVVNKVPDAQVMGDLDAALAWAEAHGGDPARVGVTGFCWGGRATWLYCAHQPRVKAGVAWYGRLVGDPTRLKPSNPVDVAGSLNCPVLGLYGGQDAGISMANVEQMRAALEEAGGASRIHVYPQAPHAFLADYRPSYRAEAAKDGWQRMLQWFQQHGVAAS